MKIIKGNIFLALLVTAMIPGFVMQVHAAGAGNNTIDGAQNVTENTQPVADGTYEIVSALDPSYVWDILDASIESGGNLQLYQKENTDAQKFVFTYNTDGCYTITNVNSGKVIDCAGGAAADGTNIQQYGSNNTDAQRWKLTDVGGGYYTLTCKCNGKVVDVAGGIAANGTNIQMYQFNDTPAQKFRLVAKGKVMTQNAEISAAVPVYVILAGIISGGYYLNFRIRKKY